MRAMVFAAGKGSRLTPLTDERAKPVVPFCNRPLMVEGLELLATAGIRDVVTNTHHLGAALPGWVETAIPDGMSLSFLHEPTLLGTGGGLANAAHLLGNGPVVVINGDIEFRPDLGAVIADHERSGAMATMVLARHANAHRLGAVELDRSGRVRRLVGRPERVEEPLEAYMFTGVQVLSHAALLDMPAKGCIVRRAYRKWIDEGNALVRGIVSDAEFSDLGTLPAYLDAHLRRGPEASIHPSAVIDPRAKLTRCWVGAGAKVGAVTLKDCVIWDGATVNEDATRTVFSREHRVPVARA